MDQLKKLVRQAINKNQYTEYMLVNLAHHYLRRPYVEGEKIDIVFIFQSASFWPSWESVWEACNADYRFNPIMLLCDESLKEKTQFKTAQKFLIDKNIPFMHVNDVNLSDLNPHIIVIHTPYDGHRPRYLYGKRLSSLGYRTVYIPYGIEISDIKKAREDHFTGGVTTTAWRIYTFSKDMIPYYKMFSPTGGEMVRSFGHPKFDHLNKEHFPSLPVDILERAKGRKVLLWKVHFPKKVNGKMITPSLDMYEKFLQSFGEYKNLFCVFMPHPKFFEEFARYKNAKNFKRKIDELENMIEFTEDDYRPVLLNCDYYIIDRSALMIEAGITGKPILYISNKSPEVMTIPVQRIVDSYYQASSFGEMVEFMSKVVILDNDYLKDSRMEEFESVMPKADGDSGYKIVEDMATSLRNETSKELNNDSISRSEFRQVIEDFSQKKELYDAKIEIEKQRFKQYLSYKLGKDMIESTRKPLGLFKLPFALRKSYLEFKHSKPKSE